MTALPHLNHVGRGALSPTCLMSVRPGDWSMLISPYMLGSYMPDIYYNMLIGESKTVEMLHMHYDLMWLYWLYWLY